MTRITADHIRTDLPNPRHPRSIPSLTLTPPLPQPFLSQVKKGQAD
jgi:hypothetical protein